MSSPDSQADPCVSSWRQFRAGQRLDATSQLSLWPPLRCKPKKVCLFSLLSSPLLITNQSSLTKRTFSPLLGPLVLPDGEGWVLVIVCDPTLINRVGEGKGVLLLPFITSLGWAKVKGDLPHYISMARAGLHTVWGFPSGFHPLSLPTVAPFHLSLYAVACEARPL